MSNHTAHDLPGMNADGDSLSDEIKLKDKIAQQSHKLTIGSFPILTLSARSIMSSASRAMHAA